MRRIFQSDAALARTHESTSTADTSAPGRANRTAPAPVEMAAAPNQVIVWNRVLLGILRTPGERPATMHPTRALALMHLAIAGAVGAISGRFAVAGCELTASRYASQAAAAASAAHHVLVALYPAMKPQLDAAMASSLATLRNGSGKSAGVDIGVRAGQSVLRLRRTDGSAATAPTFVPGATPGEYQLAPPEFLPPASAQWPVAMPFALGRADQFRPEPPPSVTSEAFANALAEVRSLGEDSSLTRTPQETLVGRFWSEPIQNFWNEIAQSASLTHYDSVADDARLFALLNTGFADDVIACDDAKYTYRFWRPVTAISHDGIPGDRAWAPLVKTPADPSYPAVHSAISFDAATILEAEFGERFEFEVASVMLPGVLRHFSSFSGAALEAGVSRIYAGDHFRFDHAAGKRLGRRIAEFALAHELRLEPSNGAQR